MLKLSHVKKTFNRGTVTEKRALTGVDLTLADGDFVTVIGGNGAGKSTLMKIIMGIYSHDSGEIVVALFEDEATVKTLRRRDGHTWLMPENPDYEPIDGDGCTILGKVVAVVRRY